MVYVWVVNNSRLHWEWFEFGQVFKWAICKNELLPNDPKWADSEKKFGHNYLKFNLSRGHFNEKKFTLTVLNSVALLFTWMERCLSYYQCSSERFALPALCWLKYTTAFLRL